MRITAFLTTLAMLAFAANSLLARLALAGPAIDAPSYTVIRLVSGAVALGLLLRWRRGSGGGEGLPGNWLSALALFVYAIAFSLAYLRLGAAVGALVLFATVQCTMISWGIWRKDRPNAGELAGLAIAFGAFVYLVSPGLDKPDLPGSVLMVLSGIAWGVYSLRGRGARDPLGDTAGNFIRSAAFCVPLAAMALLDHESTARGVVLAIASGVVASGLGYAIWYRALPGLTSTQAAIVQLTVPVIAALAAVALLDEPVTVRLVISTVLVLGGVALAILSRRPVKSEAPQADGRA
jgi:drug/metabolite transporter (DMT)-like permease